MSIPAAYAFVVLVWATTPLGIQWSTETLTPLSSVTLRMLMSLAIMLLVLPAAGIFRLDWQRNWRLFVASGFGICPAMPLVYFGAQHVPSGLVSVMFGLSPFLVGVLSAWILRDRSMGPGRYAALAVALGGLALIVVDGARLGSGALIGFAQLAAATAVFATSSILVKKYAASVNPLQQLTGSLLVACAGLVACWLLFDRTPPEPFTARSLGALIYLATAGSVLGFLGYFYLIQRISVNLVTLIPLITPALALWLGSALNGERITLRLLIGSGLIIAALAAYNRLRPRRVESRSTGNS